MKTPLKRVAIVTTSCKFDRSDLELLNLLTHTLPIFLVRCQQFLVGVRQTLRLGRLATFLPHTHTDRSARIISTADVDLNY